MCVFGYSLSVRYGMKMIEVHTIGYRALTTGLDALITGNLQIPCVTLRQPTVLLHTLLCMSFQADPVLCLNVACGPIMPTSVVRGHTSLDHSHRNGYASKPLIPG